MTELMQLGPESSLSPGPSSQLAGGAGGIQKGRVFLLSERNLQGVQILGMPKACEILALTHPDPRKQVQEGSRDVGFNGEQQDGGARCLGSGAVSIPGAPLGSVWVGWAPLQKDHTVQLAGLRASPTIHPRGDAVLGWREA